MKTVFTPPHDLRRPFLLACSLIGLNLPPLLATEGVGAINENDSNTEKFRVVWVADPSTEAIVSWKQTQGAPGIVHYGKTDNQRKHHLYPNSITPHRAETVAGGQNCFARLKNLSPDTQYFFCIKDKAGVSRRLKFQTAPATPQAFTFIAGGDSRNNRKVRTELNTIASRLKPLFIAFTGDMVSTDSDQRWDAWFDDWQHVISDDGTIIPIIPHRGNHERQKDSIHKVFDSPKDVYFALNIGGNLLRYYTLNSMLPANGEQGKWLDKDLSIHTAKVTHTIAGYHHPMRPHVSKKKEGDNPYHWAPIFYRHGLTLAIESDSHCMKRTLPIKPDVNGDEGFSIARNDPKAQVYIGEGCWGAPLRGADDAKSWTLDCDKFNGFDWIHVTPEKIEIKTIRNASTGALKVKPIDPSEPFSTPEGLELWQAKGGEVLTIPAKR
ncbi:metallophosphoesterase family protein [Verrucomicrobiaceae bacterium N1E253]|uniref:Metallophosphoesterase family protein n=1 Tax=Oceaniferula marina TaxID=2748318 RepID=A0A851GLE5_9BACT|nr:metallophosphoesterase family protein [Oceaniferula marina]NWK55995.1 metallophosphoesterase family protein [Oceaniferula marina]